MCLLHGRSIHLWLSGTRVCRKLGCLTYLTANKRLRTKRIRNDLLLLPPDSQTAPGISDRMTLTCDYIANSRTIVMQSGEGGAKPHQAHQTQRASAPQRRLQENATYWDNSCQKRLLLTPF